MADEKADYSPLLRDGSDTCLEDVSLDDGSMTLQNEIRRWRRRFYTLLLCSASAIIFVVFGALYFSLVRRSRARSYPVMTHGVKLPYSPAPIEYVNKHISDGYEMPKFMGKPRPELDEAWHELLAGTMMRFSDEELMLAGNATSIRHKDGGYVGGLGVSHSLHCVKRIKQYLHPEYYYNHEAQNWTELDWHVDHCLESLRQQILCSADVNIYTLKWTSHSKRKPSIDIPQPHACVNWEVLHGWMLGRAAKYDDLVKQE